MLELITGSLPYLIGGGGGLAVLIGGFVFRNVLGSMVGGGGKLIIYGVLIAAVVAAISFHFIQVANLRSTISTIKADMDKALLSNASLESANKALVANNSLIITELANLRTADAMAQEQLRIATAKVRDADRRASIAKIREGANVESLLRAINKSSACEMQNFARKGKCVNGVFILGDSK